MFTEITKIKNIGNFIDFSTKIFLDKNNIFYALNSHGKTTFTSILNSIKDNDINSLYGRKTLGVSGEIECIFKRGFDVYKIENKKWKKGAIEISSIDENIIIFDDNYISKNFFSEKIERDHEKNMHSLIFGKKGVDLNKKITDLNALKKVKKDSLDKVRLTFNLKEFTFLEYLKIDINILNEAELKEKIYNLNNQIINIKQSSIIKIKSNLEELPSLEYDLNNILDKFSNSKINSNSHDFAKEKILEFKNSRFHNHDEADNFIKYGVNNIVDNKCPFCHQELADKVDILEIYKKYFDESYKKEFEELNKIYKIFKEYSLSTDIEKLSSVYKSNKVLYNDVWKSNIDNLPILSDLSSENEKILKIKEYKNIIEKDLNFKLKDLNSDFDNTNTETLIKSISEINATIQAYNEIIVDINCKIDEFKKSLDTGIILNLEKEKNKLEEQLIRLSEQEKLKVKTYNDLDLEISGIDKQILTIKEELNIYTNTIRKEYLKLINQKLIDIGINHFKIGEIEPKNHVNGAYVEIGLLLNNLNIDLKNYNDNGPTFKNTLSRGDRNSLAFAFFLTYIEKLGNKEDLILIFDDPLSSHDENRQRKTSNQIKLLSQKVKQLLILTHKKDFLEILHNDFGQSSIYFNILKSPSNGNSNITKIEDINDYLNSEFNKTIIRLEEYLEDITIAPIGNLQNDIRKVFEDILITKYYRILRNNEYKTIFTYNTLNKYFYEEGLLLEIKDSLNEIAKFVNDGSHFTDVNGNEEELCSYIRQTFDLIHKI